MRYGDDLVPTAARCTDYAAFDKTVEVWNRAERAGGLPRRTQQGLVTRLTETRLRKGGNDPAR